MNLSRIESVEILVIYFPIQTSPSLLPFYLFSGKSLYNKVVIKINDNINTKDATKFIYLLCVI